MHAVVNQLHFKAPIDIEVFVAAERDLRDAMQSIPGFAGLNIVHTTDTDAVLLIFADSAETLDRLATEVGSPWMREHVVPLLAGPPQRSVGAVVATIPSR